MVLLVNLVEFFASETEAGGIYWTEEIEDFELDFWW
jgi:hypothetical protein